jgi:hypothetical protein
MISSADRFPHGNVELASLFLAAGRREDAFAEIEKGFAEHSYAMLYIDRDPRVAELRKDPRIHSLRRRMGLPE